MTGRPTTGYIIAGLLVLIVLLVFVAGLVPLLDCPWCGPGKTQNRNWMSPNGYLCLCRDGRVSVIYWWKIKRGMEKARSYDHP